MVLLADSGNIERAATRSPMPGGIKQTVRLLGGSELEAAHSDGSLSLA